MLKIFPNIPDDKREEYNEIIRAFTRHMFSFTSLGDIENLAEINTDARRYAELLDQCSLHYKAPDWNDEISVRSFIMDALEEVFSAR